MRRALNYIAERRRSFALLAFFEYLRDRSVAPGERFLFTPAVAPFVMAFADLNKYALRVPKPTAIIEHLLNAHSEEDATHFELYLRDLETLGFDTPGTFAGTLRFLWADERNYSRQTCYSLAALLAAAPLTLRLVIVEAIEAAGAAAFETLGELAADYEEQTGQELHFFGQHHKALETGHTMGSDDIEQRIDAIVLNDEELRQAHSLIDRVFEIFAAMMDELHRYGLHVRASGAASPNAPRSSARSTCPDRE